jgi:hypothetical protein
VQFTCNLSHQHTFILNPSLKAHPLPASLLRSPPP